MADDPNRDGTDRQIKGAARELEGKVRHKVGDVTDDRSEQIKGKAQEFRGKAERKIGEFQSDRDAKRQNDREVPIDRDNED
jgi:CsbD-like.